MAERRDQSMLSSTFACPVKGGMVAHTHRVIHWGNQGERDNAPGPRLAARRVCRDGGFGHEGEKYPAHAPCFSSFDLAPPSLCGPRSASQGAACAAANPCRCALSFSFSNNREASFEPPYLAAHHLPLPAELPPPFARRCRAAASARKCVLFWPHACLCTRAVLPAAGASCSRYVDAIIMLQCMPLGVSTKRLLQILIIRRWRLATRVVL